MNRTSATSSSSRDTGEAAGRLPDFIIAGAMKCGTSTLREALSVHPQIHIPWEEPKFFDIDDFETNPYNFGGVDGQWVMRDHDAQFEVLRRWYTNLLAPKEGVKLGDTSLVGEKSPTYLCSEKVPERIARLLPRVKLIFVLRDPVERAYYHYWHSLRKGRTFFNFEDTLRHSGGTILRMGFYKRQLDRYYSWYPSDQIRVLVLEEFTKNPTAELAKIEDFLGVERYLNKNEIRTHRNTGKYPRYPGLQIQVNRILHRHCDRRQLTRLPGGSDPPQYTILERFVKYVHDTVNRKDVSNPPAMNPVTRRFLADLYAKENTGLSELIGTDLGRYWSGHRS